MLISRHTQRSSKDLTHDVKAKEIYCTAPREGFYILVQDGADGSRFRVEVTATELLELVTALPAQLLFDRLEAVKARSTSRAPFFVDSLRAVLGLKAE